MRPAHAEDRAVEARAQVQRRRIVLGHELGALFDGDGMKVAPIDRPQVAGQGERVRRGVLDRPQQASKGRSIEVRQVDV